MENNIFTPLIKLEQRCLVKGLTYTGLQIGSKYRCIINACGHTSDYYLANLEKTDESAKCIICYDQEYFKRLANNGIEMLEYTSTTENITKNHKKVGRFKFVKCGHEFNAIRHHVGADKTKCQDCYKKEVSDLLNSNGYTFVKKTTPVKSIYKFNSCGHSREFFDSAALRGNAICRECNVSTYDKPSYIYLLEIETDSWSFVKLGYGKDIKNRVREYRLVKECKVTVIKTVYFETGMSALLVEKSLHKKYANQRLNPDDICVYFNRQGFSECYPKAMQDTLLKELEELSV